MRWTSRFSDHSSRGEVPHFLRWIGAAVPIVITALLLSAAAPEKRLSIYSTVANYSLPVVQRHGRDYVGLLEVLDPLGTVNAKAEGSRWRVHYNNVLGEFMASRSRARVQGRDADLPGPFLLENGRGLVPVASLESLLPRFLGGPVTFHEESGRLFVGSVATHFTAEVTQENPTQLVFHFTSPVNPSIASEPGKLHLTFSREPLVAPASPTLTFGSKTIPSAAYSESNGAAEITVVSGIPLTANFSADGRTITLAPASSAQASKTVNPPAPAASPQANPAASLPAATPSPPAARRYFAVVDASHGGNDPGEVFSNILVEKDITVALARRLRQELQNRGISTLVLRDSDTNLSLDDRAFFANNAHAAVYIAFHAASSGHGVRLYTALLPYGRDDDGPFRSWTTAQSQSIPNSQAAAASVAAELKKQQVSVRMLSAPLRPLNNVVMAAIAVEVAPQASTISQLTSPEYQQLVASAVANGLAAIRDKLGAAP
jgi:N-acetylmuramoyl-L-alanine amidase